MAQKPSGRSTNPATSEAPQRHRFRHGQAMLESLLVLAILVFAFLCFFDFAHAAVAQLLLENGAARVARADTVGFNDFQRTKSLRVSMLPVSGERLVPAYNPDALTLTLVQTYLQALTWGEANGILNYERWEDLDYSISRLSHGSTVEATFEIPKLLPWKLGALFGIDAESDTQKLRAEWTIEDHAELYLNR